jgi:hypothetical protein
MGKCLDKNLPQYPAPDFQRDLGQKLVKRFEKNTSPKRRIGRRIFSAIQRTFRKS